ncbi:N-acetylmuramoyl-L-alanine amidase [Thermaurantiacus sp.]
MPARSLAPALLAVAFLVVALLLPLGSAMGRSTAGALLVSAEGELTRVRITLSEALSVPIEVLTLADPPRLAVDLKGVSTDRRSAGGAGRIAAARLAQFDPETARLVLDLSGPAAIRASHMVAGPGGPFLDILVGPASDTEFAARLKGGRRLVMPAPPAVPADRALESVEKAVAEATAAERAATPGTPEPAASARGRRPTPAMVPPEQVRRARTKPVVVLDPGHGGRDVGAIGVNGQLEKDVTLAIARAAARILERGGKVEVRLTRTDDRYLTLGERVQLARGWNAALFISIHADSAPNVQARGASVYTLSETASDREAARLAAKENRADAIAGRDLSTEDGEAQVVLIDLALRDSMNASADFAQMLQRRLEPEGVLFRSTFHRFAGFQVLRNLGVPAVLLETGYLSNAGDAAILVSPDGQRRIATGIARAAEAWLVPQASGR